MNAQEIRLNRYYSRHLPKSKYSLLDLGCGDMNYTKYLNFSFCDAVDIRRYDLPISNVQFHNIDAMSFLEMNGYRNWDVIIMFNLIEHLGKKESVKLIEKAKESVHECLIVTTPDGFSPNGEFQETKYLSHLCGFDETELKNLGFYTSREKDGRYDMKQWHDNTNTPYPKSWDRLIGIYRP